MKAPSISTDLRLKTHALKCFVVGYRWHWNDGKTFCVFANWRKSSKPAPGCLLPRASVALRTYLLLPANSQWFLKNAVNTMMNPPAQVAILSRAGGFSTFYSRRIKKKEKHQKVCVSKPWHNNVDGVEEMAMWTRLFWPYENGHFWSVWIE